jgi:hypothetical protein
MLTSMSKSFRYNYNWSKRHPVPVRNAHYDDYDTMARIRVSYDNNRLLYWDYDLGYVVVTNSTFCQFTEVK